MHSEILPNLFIGDASAAMAPDVHKFQVIVNVSREVPFSKLLEPDVETERFDVLDENDASEQDTMTKILPKAVEIIKRARQQNKAVLVHCLEGKMRSATVVTAYIMQEVVPTGHARTCKLSLSDAKDFVRAKHRPAFDFGCYSHFEEALQNWQSAVVQQ